MKALLLAAIMVLAFTSVATAGVCLRSENAREIARGPLGPTILTITVLPDGSVKSATVAESSGNAELDKAATVCAHAWRYTPFSDKPEATTQARVVWQPDHF
ncbi:MAG TPA: TonB family protein [Rhizomicrobium sp.]|jgi:TonB family protein|nr:TonB family protein [Rhizomicrobium sp.]